MLVDTHCHLSFPPLVDDLGGVLARAADAGVTRVVVPSYDQPSWSPVAEITGRHPEAVRAAFGLHPWVADQPLSDDDLVGRLQAAGAVAVGEIGLDARIEVPLAVQIPVLARQLAIARDLDLPVILHARGGFEELLELLSRFTPRLRGIVHAWSRAPELAEPFTALGLKLGLGGAVTRPRAKGARQTAARLPLSHFVLETDAPSIGLEGVEPAACEPRHVLSVAAAIAELRGISCDEVARQTSATAAAVFGWSPGA